MCIRLIFASLVLVSGFTVHAQSPDRFRNFHGIQVEMNHFFEAEGSEIYVRLSEHGLDEKGISKMMKAYNMKGAQRKDTMFVGSKAVVLVKKEVQNGKMMYSICYLLRKDDYLTTVIGFAGYTRNVSLEHFFIEAWLNKTVPEYVYTTLSVSSFDFVGRDLNLGGACRWMSPHNVQCPDYGQMSWSVFDSEEAALSHRDLQIAIMKNKSLTNIQQDTTVAVTFEDVPVTARKIRVKIQVPRLIMGGSNVLIVYYVVAQVRNKFICCVMSHYTDDVNAAKLPLLLQEVMSVDK